MSNPLHKGILIGAIASTLGFWLPLYLMWRAL